MRTLIVKPLLSALGSTGLAVLAFTALARSGAGLDASLLLSLILAGILNIGATAALNGDPYLPTSPVPVGDNSP